MSNRFTDDSMLDMGNIAPHGRFVHLYLNGKYWGQYHLRERWSADMASSYFGGSKDDYEAAPQTWMCGACGSENLTTDIMCNTCGAGWTGKRVCPPDKWECSVEKGGCSFFNPKSQFYCDMCNRARPDLGTVRF